MTVKTGVDHTASMTTYADARVAALAAEDLCGYVLKKDSPSCGMTRVKVYGGDDPPSRTGVGIFARALLARLSAPSSRGRGTSRRPAPARELHRARVCIPPASRSVRVALGRRRPGAVSHGAQTRPAGALDAGIHAARADWPPGRSPLTAPRYARRYTAGFMDALKLIATQKRHTNVLQHMAGYLKKTLDAGSRAELTAAIEDYRLGPRAACRARRRCCVTTSACTAWSTSPGRSTSRRTRRN